MTRYQQTVPLSSLLPEKILIITVEGYKIALTMINGEPRAFQSLCPHDKAALVDGKVEGCEIQCPRHLARFDLNSGAVSAGWQVDNLKLYPARINGDVVEIDIDALHANPPEGTKKIWDFT